MVWAEALSAISIAVIALILVGCGVAAIFLLGELRRLTADIRRITGWLDHDARPIVQSTRALVDDAGKTVAAVRGEVEGLADTTRGLRRRVESAAGTIEDRLLDLDALIDVVQDEIEDTALDIAAALRTTRRGGKLFRKVKKKLAGRRR
jgi:hypothetical protein